MSEIEALEARLREDPGDTSSWLVYSDWLTDQGDARGELIALEHRLAAEALPPPERRALLSRIGAIREAHQDAWREGFRPLPGWALRWRHGFVVGIETYWTENAEKRISELLAHRSGRLLSDLSLTGITSRLCKPKPLRRLASEIWRVFPRLSVSEHRLDEDTLAVIVDPTRSAPLRALGLRIDGPDVLVQLIKSSRLDRLRALSIAGYCPSEDLAAAIGEGGKLPALERLSFTQMSLSQDSLCAILTSKTLRSLRALDTSEAILEPAADALARSELALRELSLSGPTAGDEGLCALASPRFSGLRSLSLSGSELTERAVKTLVASKHLRSLEHLSLSMPVRSSLLDTLLDRAPFSLRALDLRGANLGDDEAIRLASAEGARHLQSLALDVNDIGKEGVQALASSEHLRSLTALSLSYNRLKNEDAIEIARSEQLALVSLDLRGNPIEASGKEALDHLRGCAIAID